MRNIVEMIYHLRARLRLVDQAIRSVEQLAHAMRLRRARGIIIALRREMQEIDHLIEVLQRMHHSKSNERPKVTSIGQGRRRVVQRSPDWPTPWHRF